MIVLDSCVISEFIRPEPSSGVLGWFETLPEDQVFVPSLVLGELVRGVAKLPAGRKKDALEVWVEQLTDRFAGRILDYDLQAARAWALMMARLEGQGKVLPLMDSLVAALVQSRQAMLATRNTRDFEAAGIRLINPWDWENRA